MESNARKDEGCGSSAAAADMHRWSSPGNRVRNRPLPSGGGRLPYAARTVRVGGIWSSGAPAWL